MPIYEYRCRKCGAVIEAIQKFSDAPLSRCEACGGRLHKLLLHASFQLKGSGWYATDYAGKENGKPASDRKEGGGSGESKSPASGDSD